ncbi:MAG: hypothetical protein R3B06_29540 [Kofleriaceae bacterium]
MTPDQFLQGQVMPMLGPGEQVLHTAYMRRQPGLWAQMLVIGALILYWVTTAYFVVLTNRRAILIRTKMSFWTGGPKLLNLGIEQWDVRALAQCTTSGFANNRSMTFHYRDGRTDTLRLSPWSGKIAGTKAFLELVPQLINSGHLQQLALAVAPEPFRPGAAVIISAPDGSRYPATVVTWAAGQYQCTLADGQAHWFPEAAVAVG